MYAAKSTGAEISSRTPDPYIGLTTTSTTGVSDSSSRIQLYGSSNVDVYSYGKNRIYISGPSLSDYLTSSDLDGYAKTTDIPSLDGYAKTTDIPSTSNFINSISLVASESVGSYAGNTSYTSNPYIALMTASGSNSSKSIPTTDGYIQLKGTNNVTVTAENGVVTIEGLASNKYVSSINGQTGNVTLNIPTAYSLPEASKDTLGGIKVGTNLSISDGVLSAADTTYSLADASNSGLMSSTDVVKLAGIEKGAQVNQNAFSTISVSSTGTTGNTEITANSESSSLALNGINVTLTPDATKKTVSFNITKNNVINALGYTPGKTDYKIGDGLKLDGNTLSANLGYDYTPTGLEDTIGFGVRANSSGLLVSIPVATSSTKGLTKIDADLTSGSSNPVRNSAIVDALAEKADLSALDYANLIVGVSKLSEENYTSVLTDP